MSYLDKLQNLAQDIKTAASSRTVATKELLPSMLKILKSVEYNKHTITISAVTSISPFDAGGDGQRGFFIAFYIDTGKILVEEYGSWGGANMFNPTNRVDLDSKSYTIPPGVAVIKGSEGGHMYANIYVRPENLAPLLEEPVDLTEEEKSILGALQLKSGYKIEEINRINKKYTTYDFRKNGYVLSKLGEQVIDSLRERGFIKPGNLGLTIKGKNSAGRRW